MTFKEKSSRRFTNNLELVTAWLVFAVMVSSLSLVDSL